MRARLALTLPLVSLLAIACGGGHGGSHDGHPSTQYPAPHPEALPQIVNSGGGVLASPVFIPVTWANDSTAMVLSLEDFTSKIGTSSYWSATTGDYGVGPATTGTAVHIATSAPATMTGTQLESFLQSMLDGSHPEWGTPTANSLYVLYFPAGTTIDDGGPSCDYWLAEHSSTVVAGGTEVAYAVIPRCQVPGYTDLDAATESASHEMVESATDPFQAYAWADTDDANGAWDYLSFGGEVSDMCQDIANVDANPPDLGYVVQRSWSNSAAAAAHDPCQPTSAVYFNAAPLLPDTAQIDFGGYTVGSHAVKIPVGSSRTIDLYVFSDAATSGPVTFHATDIAAYYGGSPELSFTFDRTQAVNGEILHLTIHHDATGGFYSGGSFFWIVSKLGSQQQYWPVFVAN